MKSLAFTIFLVVGISLSLGASPPKSSEHRGSSKPEWYQRLSLSEMTIMEMVQVLARERPVAIHNLIEQVTGKLRKYNPVVAMEYRTKLTKEIFAEPTDGSGCNACKIVTQVLKLWAALSGGYPALEEDIIDFCKLLMVAVDENSNSVPWCEGVIPLQGPHIYNVFQRTTEVELCESQNVCYTQSPIVPGWPARPSGKKSKPKSPTRTRRAARSRRQRRQAEGHITIAQITDVHFEGNYTEGSGTTCGLDVCCKYVNLPVNGAGPAGRWGEYTCNIPRETMQLFIDKVEELKPDYVIFSGDVPPHTMWDETFQSQYEATAALANAMASTFTSSRILPCIGNHEMCPTNLFSTTSVQDTQFMLLAFANLWKGIAEFTDSEVKTMQEAGYYTTLLRQGLRVLSIMTNYMYTGNWYNAANLKTENAGLNDGEAIPIKAATESILREARNADEKVIIIGHHAPGNSDYIMREALWYEQLMASYGDIIVLQVAGHTHTDEFRLLFDDTNTVKSMVYVCPSVDTHGVHNPSVRVYELDETTFELLDYTQYYFNLADTSDSTTPTITKLYSAKEEYGLTSLTPQTWFDLLNSFMDDEALVVKHINNEHARAYTAQSPERTSCDENCRLNHVCRLRYASYDRYQVCANQWTVTNPPPTESSTTRPTLPILTTPAAARVNRKP